MSDNTVATNIAIASGVLAVLVPIAVHLAKCANEASMSNYPDCRWRDETDQLYRERCTKFLTRMEGERLAHKRRVKICLALSLTGWIWGPWLGYAAYQINRVNFNLMSDRAPDTLIDAPAPVRLQAPTFTRPSP